MAETQTSMDPKTPEQVNGVVLELGGLRFDVSLRDPGATLRVDGMVDGTWTPMLRFDDFVEKPHFHSPASGPSIDFDKSLGEPLAWYIEQIREHLSDWLERAGFENVLSSIDVDAISANADRVAEAMSARVPAGYVRVPGIGFKRVDEST